MEKFQTVSIRLLRIGKEPTDAVREGTVLTAWDKFDGAKIALDTLKSGTPKWSKFLELTDAQRDSIYNATAYGLIFLKASDRWFAVSFGLGHAKLHPEAIEQDFGLRIVLNTVAPNKLRSADIRTPDENTTTRRTQTARRSDQTAFSIDVERDIVRGLAGEPKDSEFAIRVAGSDALTLTKKMAITDLPKACSDALAAFSGNEYKENFPWIDQIRHIRDNDLIEKLDANIAEAIQDALTGSVPDCIHLAYPVIYDPEKPRHIRFKGFRSFNIFSDMEIKSYIDDMKEHKIDKYNSEDMNSHKVCECDSLGNDEGGRWRIRECLVYECDLNGQKYVLSGDRWYCIDENIAKDVAEFFASLTKRSMPSALADDNEESYNERISIGGHNLLCLDRKTLKPTGASSAIETCDFLSEAGALIHVKDHTSSSRLSHLFNQGTVSARVLKTDGIFRDQLRDEIEKQEKTLSLAGYRDLIDPSTVVFDSSKHEVVYAVLCSSGTNKLPFFSLVTLRQAAKELQALGFSCAFAFIPKPPSTKVKKTKKAKSSGGTE